MDEEPHKDRRFNYSLRTFLLLIAVVGLWLGWKCSNTRQQRLAVAALKQLYGARVSYDFEYNNRPFTLPPEPAWLIKLLGIDFFHNVVVVGVGQIPQGNSDCGPVLSLLHQLPSLRQLILIHCALRDEDLKYLADLTDLELLNLRYNRLSGDGFKYLANLRNLKGIDIQDNPLTDDGLKSVRRITGQVVFGQDF